MGQRSATCWSVPPIFGPLDEKSPGLLQMVCGPPSWAASPRGLSPRGGWCLGLVGGLCKVHSLEFLGSLGQVATH